MIKKFAFYCSGGASRVIKFYLCHNYNDFPFEFIFYDGNQKSVIASLKKISSKGKVIVFNEDCYESEWEINFKMVSTPLLENLESFDVDFLFCFGSRILRGKIIDVFRNKIVNFHPSILPAFPGLASIDQAVSTSVQVLGNTAHFIDEGVDTGPIIMQSVISRSNYSIYEDVLKLQIPMLKNIWLLLIKDKIKVQNGMVIVQADKQLNIFNSIKEIDEYQQ